MQAVKGIAPACDQRQPAAIGGTRTVECDELRSCRQVEWEARDSACHIVVQVGFANRKKGTPFP